MSAVNQIIGGTFQGPDGSILANGYITFEINSTAVVNTSTRVCNQKTITVNLDNNGNVPSSPVVSLWPNDIVGGQYKLSAYTQQGQLVYGPVPAVILSSPSPFNLGALVP